MLINIRLPLYLLLITSFAPTMLQAQEFRVPSVDNARAQKWDFSFDILASESDSTSGTNGSGLDVSSEVGWGFGIGYNLNNRFALGFDFSLVKPKYTADLVDEDGEITTINHRLTVSTGQFKGTWNILQGPITPYVDLGLGWTYIDSNVASSPPITGCWWDPFWGYICAPFYSTYNDTSFSYGGGLGVRWQINPRFFLKGSYNMLAIDLSSSAGDPSFNTWKLSIGTSY